MIRERETPLSGWGRTPLESCALVEGDTTADLMRVLQQSRPGGVIPRGLGRSYGDAALNRGGRVLSTRAAGGCVLDPSRGTVRAGGGTSLEEIIRHAVPAGWFLPVTPGTRHVTVGGAIASDVHGKNHHRDGTFSRFVERFELLLPSGQIVDCAADTNDALFRATTGGMGLTGVIVSATLRLRPITSGHMRVEYHRAKDLSQALALFAEHDAAHEYSVAWIDCLAAPPAAGRSLLMFGDHLPGPRRALPAEPFREPWSGLSVDAPEWLLDRWSVRAFNALYFGLSRARIKAVTLQDYFYPLDALGDWNRLYGARGFIQYQFAIPLDGASEGLSAVLGAVRASGEPAFLGVLKSLGRAGTGLLSFPIPGVTLALDIPMSSGVKRLAAALDRIVLDHGGRVYLAKDALLSAETFAAMYPLLDQFLEVRARVDPHGALASSMARRLKIVAP